MKKRVFSGVQPTGMVHIGNYLGAIKNWVTLLDGYECIFCIVDYHAITVPYDPKAMQERILHTAIAYMACGIDPDRCTIFVQSHVPEHTELAWILNTVAPLGMLRRMTQFKEKAGKEEGEVSVGLLDYPVLQAADILLYKAAVVPVGEDQAQHLEFARDIARRFNNAYGKVFPEPQALLGESPRILGLDGTKKMSKSMNNYISMMDEPDIIRKKMRRAVTDSGREITFSDSKPAITNLLTMYTSFTDRSSEGTEEHFRGKGYSELKDELAEVIIESLKPIQERWRSLALSPDEVWTVLARGAESCRKRARRTMEEVKRRMGLLR